MLPNIQQRIVTFHRWLLLTTRCMESESCKNPATIDKVQKLAGNSCSQLLISTILIADISNSNYWYQQLTQNADINNSNCWYQQFELLISLIRIVDINIETATHCWYQYLIVDISNWNCWYQQFELVISTIVNKC